MIDGSIIAIDPGHAGRGSACAAITDGALVEVWFERVPCFGPDPRPPAAVRSRRDGPPPDIAAVIIEQPVYQGQRSDSSRPVDLINLAWSGGMLAGAFAARGKGAPVIAWPSSDTRGVRGWKGSEPKPLQHKRLWRILDAAEREVLGGDATGDAIAAAVEKGALKRWGIAGAACYPKKFDTHNLLDAAALGLTYCGRLERAR